MVQNINLGTVTAANSIIIILTINLGSTLADGASALVLSTLEYAKEKQIAPIAKVLGFADAGI